jgi:hypothetical protein
MSPTWLNASFKEFCVITEISMPDQRHSNMPPRPLNVNAVAQHLGVSASHVRKLCAGGKLRHFRAGVVDGKGPIRIPISALEEFERCGSSCSGENGTPTSELEDSQNEQAWGPRIVRLQKDD